MQFNPDLGIRDFEERSSNCIAYNRIINIYCIFTLNLDLKKGLLWAIISPKTIKHNIENRHVIY